MPRGFTTEARAARQRLFEVEVSGADALGEMLRSKNFLSSPTRRLIEYAGRAAWRTAQRAAKPHPTDKGTLGRAIRFDILPGGMAARVDIARGVSGIAFTIEEGRRPGRRPPYGPIKRWMISHGIISGARGDSKKVRYMQEDIKLRGTRGIHFMQQAEDIANKVLKGNVPRTEQEIKDLWVRA